MPIVFSDHARLQLKRRRISNKRALETVRSPQEIIQGFKNRRLRRKMYGARILQVVTISEGSRITVISGYYLKR